MIELHYFCGFFTEVRHCPDNVQHRYETNLRHLVCGPCRLACYACSHQGINSAFRSQHCRKSDHLKPRVTTYVHVSAKSYSTGLVYVYKQCRHIVCKQGTTGPLNFAGPPPSDERRSPDKNFVFVFCGGFPRAMRTLMGVGSRLAMA